MGGSVGIDNNIHRLWRCYFCNGELFGATNKKRRANEETLPGLGFCVIVPSGSPWMG